MAGAASWQSSQDPQLLLLRFYALKFSATHLKKAAVANNRARASNTNPQDNEPGGGRRWALSEEGAVLLLERPKRAINPQIQRRTQALSSLRKAWDVSAGRTNHAASPAEVASSAKPRCSPGYYTQILSICCPPGCRQATPSALPARGEPALTPAQAKTSILRFKVPLSLFLLSNTHQEFAPQNLVGSRGLRASPSRLAAILQREQRTPEPSTTTAPSITVAPSISVCCCQTRGCRPCVQTHTPD